MITGGPGANTPRTDLPGETGREKKAHGAMRTTRTRTICNVKSGAAVRALAR